MNERKIKPTKIVLSFKNETLTLRNILAIRYTTTKMLKQAGRHLLSPNIQYASILRMRMLQH